MDCLELLLSSNDCVSARFLGNHLSVHVQEARLILKDFRSKSSLAVSASYIISGLRNRDGREYESLLLVDEERLEEEKNKFISISSIALYGIHRRGLADFKEQYSAIDDEQALELLMRNPQFDHFILNGVGGISLSGVSVAPVGRRQLSAQKLSAPARDISKESAADQISRVFAAPSSSSSKPASKPVPAVASYFGKTASSAASSSTMTSKSVKVPKKAVEAAVDVIAPAAGNAPSKKSSDAVANDEPSKKSSDDSAMDAMGRNPSTSSLDGKGDGDGDGDVDDDGDAEWDDGSGYRPDKKSLLTRESKGKKRIIMPETEEDGSESVIVGKSSSAAYKPHIHGAMDDYFEDVAIAAELRSQASTEEDPAQTKPKKKTKLVEKTFVDEKGYLVTKMEMEEVSDHEEDVPAVTSSKPVDSSKPKSAPAVLKKTPSVTGKKSNAPPPNQKGMTSFFSKK